MKTFYRKNGKKEVKTLEYLRKQRLRPATLLAEVLLEAKNEHNSSLGVLLVNLAPSVVLLGICKIRRACLHLASGGLHSRQPRRRSSSGFGSFQRGKRSGLRSQFFRALGNFETLAFCRPRLSGTGI